MGLNDSYDHVRSQILMKMSLPSLSEVYNILDQEDSQRSARTSSQAGVDASAFQVSSNAPYRKSKPVCTHCGGFGHTVDRCYKIHGYPPGLKPRGKFYPPKKNISQHVSASANAISTETSDANQTSVPSSFTPEQLHKFIAYFNAQLQDHINTPASDGLLPSPSAVPSACKASSTFLPLYTFLSLASLLLSLPEML